MYIVENIKENRIIRECETEEEAKALCSYYEEKYNTPMFYSYVVDY